jgi:hypothetical protein
MKRIDNQRRDLAAPDGHDNRPVITAAMDPPSMLKVGYEKLTVNIQVMVGHA